VLHSQPTVVFHEESVKLAAVATATQKRYAEIMRDVELLINDHSTPLSPSNLGLRKR
jgi:IMP and pyridine-specific 5'-nucleotidase